MSDTLYFSSQNIKMYPSARRSDYYDRNARLNSEQNLITTVNRLTGQDSFIISGLTISEDGNTLNVGQCNIHGYLFRLLASYDISEIPGSTETPYLALKIALYKVSSSLGGTQDYYYTLCGVDSESEDDEDPLIQANTAITKDVALDSGNNYRGICLTRISASRLVTLKEAPTNSQFEYYYLPIGVYDTTAGKWKSIQADDGQALTDSTEQTYSVYKLKTTDIQINEVSSTGKLSVSDNTTNDYYNNPQSLDIWLKYNMVIDDGVIE